MAHDDLHTCVETYAAVRAQTHAFVVDASRLEFAELLGLGMIAMACAQAAEHGAVRVGRVAPTDDRAAGFLEEIDFIRTLDGPDAPVVMNDLRHIRWFTSLDGSFSSQMSAYVTEQLGHDEDFEYALDHSVLELLT